MVDNRRIVYFNKISPVNGCVIYWMQRDQRVEDNYALLFAQEKALEMGQNLVVVFCLLHNFLGAENRHFAFMIKGLQEVEADLKNYDIPFFLLHGSPEVVIPSFVNEIKAGLLVTDFNPLRISMIWKDHVRLLINISFVEVDAHNILPCRSISDKMEYAAFTLRKKIEKFLPEYLTDIPGLLKHPSDWNQFAVFTKSMTENKMEPTVVDWNELQKSFTTVDGIAGGGWITPGSAAAKNGLIDFIHNRLDAYSTDRNFPEKLGQSDLSPWLHFGHLSAQRVAFEVSQSDRNPESKKAFLEELIVRRELADNYCLHNPDYDNFSGFPQWARMTLDKHRNDPREYCYSVEQFEEASTHDILWNAAQTDMVVYGKMHGFMRMYWAKKILEWTASPEEAMAIAIYLNDKYELDGRDPNGYAGIAWAIGGVHDRPWGERKVFGMIRYMNYQGCKRKFDIQKYIRRINNPEKQ